jgi:hypothetical protein
MGRQNGFAGKDRLGESVPGTIAEFTFRHA